MCLHVFRVVGVCLHVPARVERAGHVSSFVGLYLGLRVCLLRLEGQACNIMFLCTSSLESRACDSMSLRASRTERVSALVCGSGESGMCWYAFARIEG